MTGNAAQVWATGVVRGFCVGTADLVPGVSGATVALVFGIYERLVAAIRGFDRVFAARLLRLDLPGAARRVDAGFLLPLVAGVVFAAAFFTRVAPLAELMDSHRIPMQSFFFGLVAAALAILVREALRARTSDQFPAAAAAPSLRAPDVSGPATKIVERCGSRDALRWKDAAAAGGGLAAGWGIAVAVPATTPDTAWFVFSAGAFAAAAMILPGISGAYVLVLLKKYTYVLAALGRLDFAVLVPFGLGVAAGLALLSRALGWLLGRFRRTTLFALSGLVAGSLWSLWPYRMAAGGRSVPAWPESFEPSSLLLAGAGMAALAALHLASRFRA